MTSPTDVLGRVGINVRRDGSDDLGAIRDAGFEYIRLEARIADEGPPHVRDDLRPYLRRANDLGLRTLVVLARDAYYWPDWRQRTDAYVGFWRGYYGDLVDAWQAGNEPDHRSPSSWDLPADQFSALLAATRNALGPDAYLIAGGLADGQSSYLAGVDLSPIDAVALHPYTKQAYEMPVMLAGYREYTGDKPIVLSEWGCPADWGEDRQADDTEGMIEWATHSRVPLTIFCWTDAHVAPFGLHRADGSERPAMQAARGTIAALTRATEPDRPTEPTMPTPRTREEVIAISHRTADQYAIPRLLLLGCGCAESGLVWNARRPENPGQDASFWPDVSGGVWQQTVRYDPDYRGGGVYPGPSEIERVLTLQYDVNRAAQVAAKQLKAHWNGIESDDAFLRAMYLYNWPAGNGRPYSPKHEENYRRGLAEAKAILGATQQPPQPAGGIVTEDIRLYLAGVVERARREIGKPYAGPIVGQPDSARRGSPGWDCSSFVEGMLEAELGSDLYSWAYTDTMANESVWVKDPVPGTPVFYHYPDSAQPNTYWPHVGLWLSPTEVLDCRWGRGVGIGPHVTPVLQGDSFRRTMLPKKLAGVTAPVDPPIRPSQPDPVEALRGRVASLETALAHVCDVVAADRAREIANEAQRIREEFIGPRPAA